MILSTAITYHLRSSARHGGQYFNYATILHSGARPFGATNDVAVDGDRHASSLDRESMQQLRHGLLNEGLVLAVDAYPAKLCANRSACAAARGASVTPCRKCPDDQAQRRSARTSKKGRKSSLAGRFPSRVSNTTAVSRDGTTSRPSRNSRWTSPTWAPRSRRSSDDAPRMSYPPGRLTM